ncbi:hypothetical protein CW745_05320 [Psychromonas sp. psych-6C06]|uniref:hypothetical protein n=1 Tax=Psychromonas sp. psych-6C06 TaxID=2058089 RepID=UPI000C34BA29|nr:hypothetical protein [Psychromonas sp. psych-6C06]PKF62842.1 hypothetical protein CW745_05320 [Psychromonas sp. psych-6C06]
MQLSKKAALFSGCIFPGAGYFLVGNLLRGYSFVTLSFSLLALIIYDSLQKALTISQQIVSSGQIPTDINGLIIQIRTTPGAFSSEIHTFMTIAIAALWLVSIIDCYRLGRYCD